MSASKIGVPGFYFTQPEVQITAVQSTYASSTVSNGITTVTTSAAHGLPTPAPGAPVYVTFSGASTTGYNGTIFTVLSVPSTTTFTIGSGNLPAIAGATIYVQQVFLFPYSCTVFCIAGANCVVEYNPDNTGLPQPFQQQNITSVSNIVTGATWRTLIPAGAAAGDTFSTDGYAVRIRVATGTAGTTYYSVIE